MSALPIEQSYESVCPLIMKQCHTIRRQRRQQNLPEIDMDDLTQEAFVGFLRAQQTYKKDKSKFSTWVYHNVRNALSDMSRQTVPIPYCPESLDTLPAKDRREWMSELSEDGLNVVELTLRAIHIMTPHKKPSSKRKAITKHLRELGWDRQRIHNTFNEIRRNLP